MLARNVNLVGIGLYTPAEAERLSGVPTGKIVRWLRGHTIGAVKYEPLWTSQVELGDGKTYLGFRDLMELKTADGFMRAGVSAIAIRKAIAEGRRLVDDERPLSTQRFKTDGQTIFVEIGEKNGDSKLLDLFRNQFAFKKIIERSLRDVEFADDAPQRWWPATRSKAIVVDPTRAFGQPIDEESGVPTAVLAAAAEAEGSVEAASRVWSVKPQAIRRAIEFEKTPVKRAA
jgi:uncharacterized protein (DUF433 family)